VESVSNTNHIGSSVAQEAFSCFFGKEWMHLKTLKFNLWGFIFLPEDKYEAFKIKVFVEEHVYN
jgi:hypothetical protein